MLSSVCESYISDLETGFKPLTTHSEKFLIPVDINDHSFHRFTREFAEEKPITSRFPEAVLDLTDRVTPPALSRKSCDLPEVLKLIAEAAPALTSDQRYVRLIELVERT